MNMGSLSICLGWKYNFFKQYFVVFSVQNFHFFCIAKYFILFDADIMYLTFPLYFGLFIVNI